MNKDILTQEASLKEALRLVTNEDGQLGIVDCSGNLVTNHLHQVHMFVREIIHLTMESHDRINDILAIPQLCSNYTAITGEISRILARRSSLRTSSTRFVSRYLITRHTNPSPA